jgi:hypothetical protein
MPSVISWESCDRIGEVCDRWVEAGRFAGFWRDWGRVRDERILS